MGAAMISLMIRGLCDLNPEAVELYYSRGLFVGIRWLVDHTISLIPVPMIYVFFFSLIIAFYLFVRKWKNNKSLVKDKILMIFYALLTFVSSLVTIFLWIWGFNYARIPIEEQIGFKPKALKVVEIQQALYKLTPELLEARFNLSTSDEAINESQVPLDFEDQIVSLLRSALAKNDIPTYSDVNPRMLKPKGLLKKFGAIGIYWPFVGESNLDAALHPLQWPEVMAHEITHAYGWGDEGTCSFVAYLALQDAEDPYLRYAGLLDYWRSLASNYLRYEQEAYQNYRKTLPLGLVNDLNAINERSRQYTEFFPKFRRKTYNVYLKTQGISEGLENYNRVLMLVEAWKKDQEMD